MKKIVSFLLLVCAVFSTLVGCVGGGDGSSSSSSQIEEVDYASQMTLNLTSTDTQKLKMNVSKYRHIDGDTTHFRGLSGANVPEEAEIAGILKARYLAVDTPESTGEIEEWGKAASRFTEEKLASATSIVLESNTANWETDANGRYLVWVWYKAQGSDTYRNINIELLQAGLAKSNNIESCNAKYKELCMSATLQAQALELHVFSDDPDPDYFYGEAINTDLKSVRTNLDKYKDKRVALTAVVTMCYSKGSIYIEDQDVEDETTGLFYGMPVFYGMGNLSWGDILAPGNKVFLVGEVSYSEGYGYQICDLVYFPMTNNPENIKIVGEEGAFAPAYKETTLEEFLGKVTINKNVVDAESGQFVKDENGEIQTETKEYDYAELALATSVSMKGLTVKSIYTTESQNVNSNGAMTLTCEDAEGREIDIRTAVLYDENKKLVTASTFQGKTIDVKGIVDYYDSDYAYEDESPYQIKVFNLKDFTIH